MEFAPFYVAIIAGVAAAYWAAYVGWVKLCWGMLPAVMVFAVIYDAVAIGGFHLDGVTSFPVFAGIAISIIWLPLWAVAAGTGYWIRKRFAASQET